jgi:hypothetical protein
MLPRTHRSVSHGLNHVIIQWAELCYRQPGLQERYKTTHNSLIEIQNSSSTLYQASTSKGLRHQPRLHSTVQIQPQSTLSKMKPVLALVLLASLITQATASPNPVAAHVARNERIQNTAAKLLEPREGDYASSFLTIDTCQFH